MTGKNSGLSKWKTIDKADNDIVKWKKKGVKETVALWIVIYYN